MKSQPVSGPSRLHRPPCIPRIHLPGPTRSLRDLCRVLHSSQRLHDPRSSTPPPHRQGPGDPNHFMAGNARVRHAGWCPSIADTSPWHPPHASTFSNTWPRPGSGTGRSTSSSRPPVEEFESPSSHPCLVLLCAVHAAEDQTEHAPSSPPTTGAIP